MGFWLPRAHVSIRTPARILGSICQAACQSPIWGWTSLVLRSDIVPAQRGPEVAAHRGWGFGPCRHCHILSSQTNMEITSPKPGWVRAALRALDTKPSSPILWNKSWASPSSFLERGQRPPEIVFNPSAVGFPHPTCADTHSAVPQVPRQRRRLSPAPMEVL